MKDIRISIRLTEEEHKKFKIISIKKNESMQNLLLEYIRKVIYSDESKEYKENDNEH